MNLPNRKSPRLKGYDYNKNGAYFITLCTDGRRLLLSEITGLTPSDIKLRLTPYGKIVEQVIEILPKEFGISLDAYVIMPNHIHLLFMMLQQTENHTLTEKRSYLSKIVGYLKMNVTKEIHRINQNEIVWQCSYHDKIVRDEKQYLRIWNYIHENPLIWQFDCYHPEQNDIRSETAGDS